jgi:putative membrane protein
MQTFLDSIHAGNLLAALVYALLGIVIFVISFAILDLITPYHLWREIVEDKNIALAILLGAISLGMCIIIAAAVH